jgi:hypothetical protein
MGRVIDHIDGATAEWVGQQHLFFVATAPSTDGRVNVSPKGLDSFRVVSPTTVAYLDLTGSGAETIAHARDNGRITFMFCAFDGPPRIVRLFGTATAHPTGTEEFNALVGRFPERRGVRSIIVAEIDRVQDSCGYGVPRMEFQQDRTRLDSWVENRTDDEIAAYWDEKNSTSIDGLPALRPGA